MAAVAHPDLIHPSRIVNRWAQLVAGIIAMMAIANLQYAWTLFTKPMQSHLHVSLTAIQGIFTAFILVETWLVPFEGYLVDRIGPRLMLGAGGILVGLGWILSGQAETLRSLYFWYIVGGIGAGIVYGGTIGNALKWFPDHRGSLPERIDTPLLGMGVGPYRPRKHHVHRLYPRGGGGICAVATDQPSGLVHRPVRLMLLRLG